MRKTKKTKQTKSLPRVGQFIPTMQPSYASVGEVMEAHAGKTYADIKYDGYRVQIHKKGEKFWVFTRNGNELNYECYPEIVEIVESLPDCIIEAELVGSGTSHKEVFDNMKKRFRRPGIRRESIEKYLESGIVDESPLSLRVFDTLRYEDIGLSDMPLEERRKYTERFNGNGIRPSETRIVTSAEELESVVMSYFDARQEGMVCKNPASKYVPGSRTIDWVKFKRAESLDLVVVGIYNSEQYATNLPFTSVLCATYNEETGKYETIGKISVTRDGLADQINGGIAGRTTEERPDDVVFSEKLNKKIYRQFVPDAYIDPEQSVVLEVNAMNLNLADNWQSCGYEDGKAFSMRIGYAKQLRYDKNSQQATTTDTIRKLYEIQEGGKDGK